MAATTDRPAYVTAVKLNGHLNMRNALPPKPFIRKPLDHGAHFEGRFGATYFITICCRERHRNQLCRSAVANSIFQTAALYDQQQKWYLLLLLLMPDHLHALISIGGDTSLGDINSSFKRATTKFAGVSWQRNFFDHRLRRDEGLRQKAEYICENPVRAGLVNQANDWPWVLDRAALEKMAVQRTAATNLRRL
jgi:putative transposase